MKRSSRALDAHATEHLPESRSSAVCVSFALVAVMVAACGDGEMTSGPSDSEMRDGAVDARTSIDAGIASDASASADGAAMTASDATAPMGGDASTARAEVCGTGLDEDGDGQVDEACTCTLGAEQSCFPGLPEMVGRGPCHAGLQRCIGSDEFATWGPCEGAIGPRPELCSNSIDDDCDGDVDDGPDCACVGGETRDCYDGPPATDGVGICMPGMQACTTDGWGACEGSVLPRIELCANGIDDDCNGAIDDGPTCICAAGETRACYTGAAATRGVGRCHDGTETCAGGTMWGACTGEVLPRAEICDNDIDDDCDGMTAEGAACACAARPEVCNGRDDDCDGRIDEGGVCPCLDTTGGTPWQEWLDDDVHCFGEDLDEDPDEFDHADIRAVRAWVWRARAALGIDFDDDSTIEDEDFCDGAHTGGVFTYFQTFVTLTAVPSSFVVQNGGTDDGVQVWIFNSRYPAGHTSNAWTFFESGGRAELAPFMVAGRNRIVLIHIDDNPTTRALRNVQLLSSGMRLSEC